jgi:hypothetical protein
MLQTALKHATLGNPRTYGALTMIPLEDGQCRRAAYLTLDEAMTLQLVQVTEVSEHGRVSELRVRNEAERPVLLLDGEELVGAKQNRIVNLTILVPARADVVIPVTCVESGRWHSVSERFSAASRAQFAEGRASKSAQVTRSLEVSGEAVADQQEVWNGIARKADRMRVRSATGAMSEIFERHAVTVEEHVRALAPADGQTGAIFGVNGRVVGLDLFDCEATLAKMLPKIVSSYAIDAIEAAPQKPRTMAASAARRFLERVTLAEVVSFPTVGLGQAVRLKAERVTGGGLVLDERVVHLAAFDLPS